MIDSQISETRDERQALTTHTTPMDNSTLTQDVTTPANDIGYGRARLRLGVTGVGLWVVVSAVLLATDAHQAARTRFADGLTGDLMLLVMFVAAYAILQFPLDLLGGYIVPKRFGRATQSPAAFAVRLARGVFVHSALLLAAGLCMLLGGLWAGQFGAFAGAMAFVMILATTRRSIARCIAQFTSAPLSPFEENVDSPRYLSVEADDHGFTGGIDGHIYATAVLIPTTWHNTLPPDVFEMACHRRLEIVRSGAWRSGRFAALMFVAIGLLIATLLSSSAGSAIGVIETSLWFTLWSFLGLLILPTLSRQAISRIDRRLYEQGVLRDQIERLAAFHDRTQDGEPARAKWIERIFHPIPSVNNRSEPARSRGPILWDVARTAIYLGLGSMSLLTRSVHCNVGRPALWVWLPVD